MLKPFYLPAKGNNNKQIIACIYWKLHIIENLKVNFLIENNIEDAEDIKIDIDNKKTYMPGYKAIVSIIVW